MSGNFADWIKYYSLSGLAAKIANIEKVIGTLPNTENPVLNGTVTVLGGPVIIDNQPGNARSVIYTSAGQPRWLVGADASAETGGNEGSNFVVQSYTDAGAANEQTLTISRTDGTVQLAQRPSWGDGAGGIATPWDSSNLNHAIYETVAAAEQAAAVAAAATAAAIVTAGENAAELYVPIVNPVMQTGATIVNNESSNPSLTISAIGNALGALIGMLGNGVSAAAKYLQVKAGHFRILADDAATPLLDIDDSGNAEFAGAVTALAFPNAALSGTPTAPTATAGDNSTTVATTAFVTAAVAAGGGGGGGPYETVADAQIAYQNLEVYAQQQAAGAVTLAGENAAQIYATIATATLLQNTKANIASPSFTGTVTILGNTVFGGSGPAGFTISNSSLAARWQTKILGTENGGDTGSDLTISRVDDSANVTPALTITRATGQSTFATRPQWVVNGVNATPWDSTNFNSSTYLPVNNTTSGPTATLFKASGAQFFSLSLGNNNAWPNSTASYFSSGNGTSTVYMTVNNAAGSKANSGPNGLVQAGDAAMLWDGGGMVIGPFTGTSLAPGGLRISVDGIVNTGFRPTFAGNLAWDAGNFNPANYLTVQAAGATYLPMISGVVQGSLGFVAPSTSTLFRGMTILSGTSAGNKTRWNIGSDIADTGSNNGGADLRFYRYDDNGLFLGAALNIVRSSGAAQFSTRPTWLVNGVAAVPWDSTNLNPSNVPTNVNPQFTNNTSTFGPSSAARFVNGASPITRSIGVFPGLAATNYSNVVQQGDNAIVANPDLTTFASLAITPAGATNSRNVGIRMSPAPTGSYVPGTYDLQFFGYSIFDSPPLFSVGLSCPGTASFGSTSNFFVRPTFAGNTPWDTGNLPGGTANGSTTFANTIVMPNGANVTGGKYNTSYFNGITTFDGGVTLSQNASIAMNGPQLALSAATIFTAAGTSTFNGATSFSQAATFTNGFKVNAGTTTIAGTLNVAAATNFTAPAQFSSGAGFVNSPTVPTAGDAATGPGSNIAASTLYVQQAIAAQALPKKGFNFEIQFPWTTPTFGAGTSGGTSTTPPMGGYDVTTAQWHVQGIVTVGTTCVLQGGVARSWTSATTDTVTSYVTLFPKESYNATPTIPDGTNFTNVVATFEWEPGANTIEASNVNNNIIVDPGDTLILWAPYTLPATGLPNGLTAVSVVLQALAVVS